MISSTNSAKSYGKLTGTLQESEIMKMSKVKITGKIGAIRLSVINNRKVANFNLYKNNESTTSPHLITAWEGKGIDNKIFTSPKGTNVTITGQARGIEYINSTGNKKKMTEIIAEKVIITGGRYHYEWHVYTDNLCYGHLYLGKSKSKTQAIQIGQNANKGCFVTKRKRVYND